MWRTDSLKKISDAEKDWRQEEKGMTESWWDGRMASLTQWIWVEQALGVGDGQGIMACCTPWGREESDMTEHWTDLIKLFLQQLFTSYQTCNKLLWNYFTASSQNSLLLPDFQFSFPVSPTHTVNKTGGP